MSSPSQSNQSFVEGAEDAYYFAERRAKLITRLRQGAGCPLLNLCVPTAPPGDSIEAPHVGITFGVTGFFRFLLTICYRISSHLVPNLRHQRPRTGSRGKAASRNVRGGRLRRDYGSETWYSYKRIVGGS